MNTEIVAFNEASIAGDGNPDTRMFVDAITLLCRTTANVAICNYLALYDAGPFRRDFISEISSVCTRDERDLFFGALSRCPGGLHGEPDVARFQHVTHCGEELRGVAIAIAKDCGVVSLCSNSKWMHESISVSRSSNVSGGDSDPGSIEVVNFWDYKSASTYRKRLETTRRTRIVLFDDLWRRRRDILPSVVLLENVRRDLLDLETKTWKAVRERLWELQDAVDAWDPGAAESPVWASRVTPESSSRRKYCYFEEGGVERLFEMHARYTPGAGRIHFRIDRASGNIVVAYIGTKLGA